MIALVRSISPHLAEALVQRPGDRPADARRAAAEHAHYREALAALGAEVRVVPPDPRSPDDCFIEDTVVVARGVAVLTRPGAARRRSEIDGVAASLPAHLHVCRLTAPATLDGGDVLRLGDTLFVGLSGRTNDAAISQLRDAFAPVGLRVVPIRVARALHLKCHASALDDATVLFADGAVDPAPFRAVAEVVPLPASEAYAANVVAWGGRALVAAGYPVTARALRERGLDPVPLDMTEIARADGSLTCLSVLIPPEST